MYEIVKEKYSDHMTYDHTFYTEEGKQELCHHTGKEVLMDDGIWWYEFIDSNGDLHYGN